MKKLCIIALLASLGLSFNYANAQTYTMSSSGTYTTCSGNFYDGGGPGSDYPNNQNVTVTFNPSTPGAKMSVTFSSFNTQAHYNEFGNFSQIDDDILYVYNGPIASGTPIGTLNGQAGYGTITSTHATGSLTFKFVSHAPYYTPPSGTRAGWAATVSCSSTPPTDITMIAGGAFTTCGGNFYDSGGPAGNYMDNQSNITTTLYPGTPGEKISVIFNSFNTQTHYNELGNFSQIDDDILYVYNGPNASGIPIGTLNGQAGYGTITSTDGTGSLTFKFVSHAPYYTPPSGSRAGWAATISCSPTAPSDITMIAGGSFTTCGGNFYDSGGPGGNYMDNQNNITTTLYPATPGAKISVTFSSFNTQTHYNEFGNFSQIDDDILYVYNGPNAFGTPIGILNGQAGYGTITSTDATGSLTFKFVSHTPYYTPPSGERAGWAATISCSPTAPSDISMIAGGSFTTCGGNFYDSGGPGGDYMDNQNNITTTLYPATPGAKISVTFSSFNTQTHYNEFGNFSQIDDDILYVYNGPNAFGTPIGILNGQAGYGTITSTHGTGSLTFKFVSHTPYYTPPSGSRAGWVATISCSPTAPTDITMIAGGAFTTCGGNFYDSGGPGGNYMDNQDNITTTLYPATPGAKISVTFISFNTQTHYNEFGNFSQIDDDILYVYNGPNAVGTPIGILNGQSGYGTVTSTDVTGSLTFKFVSHAPYYTPPSGVRAGWVATISCSPISPTDITMIAGSSFKACGGNFYDGGGPGGNYMDNQNNIVTTLHPDCSSNKISVTFNSFSTQINYNEFGNFSQIKSDILYVYNGSNINAPLIATLSGSTVPGTVTSTAIDGSLTFKFVSYAPYYTPTNGVRAGWAATISCNCSPAIAGTAMGTPSPICAGGTTSVSLSNYSGCIIQWQTSNNNVSFIDIPGANNSTYFTPVLSVTTYYRAKVSNGSSCTNATSNVVVITVNPMPIATITPNGPTTFCQGGSVMLSTSTANTYQWSNGATTQSITVSTSGNYSVIVSNPSGCTAASSILTVLANQVPNVTVNSPTICAGQSATLTVNGATSYQWSNGMTTNPISVSPASTTTYTVTGTTTGCSSLPASAQVTVNSLPNLTVNSPTICSGQIATLTASGAISYQWSNGMTTNPISVSPASTMTYTVTGTTSGCSSLPASAQVTVNSLPNVTVNSPTICIGQSATMIANGAANYVWSNGATTNSITVSPTSTTTYTVTGTTVGCSSAPASAQVTVNSLPVVTANNQTICSGQSATLTASGATNYVWSTGATTASIAVSPNTTTTYTVLGIALGCSSLPVSVQVIVNALPIVTVNNATVCAGQPATLTANTSNGVSNYQWNTGQTTNAIIVTPSSSTVYTVTGTLATGCSATATAQLNVNPTLSANVSIGPSVFCSGQNMTFTPMPINGGTMPDYQWFVNNIFVGSGNTYSTATLTNGAQLYCKMLSNALCASPSLATSPVITVTVLAPPNVQITPNDITTFCQGSSVTLTASPTGSYSWSTGATTKSITVSTTGAYTVKVTTANGCSAVSAPTSVTVNPLPQTPVIFPPGPILFCQGEEVMLTSSFANAYSWSNGATTQSITVSSSGTYSVIVANANACTAASSLTTVSVQPTAQPAIVLSLVCSGNDATVTATPTNGGSSPTFQWWVNDAPKLDMASVLLITDALHTTIVKCQMTSNADCAPSPPLSAQMEITLDCIVGANEATLPESFKLFPNPSNGLFAVEFFLPEAKMVAHRVKNVLGQVIWTAAPMLGAGEYRGEIDLGKGVMPGIYLLETRLDGKAFFWKIKVQ